MQHHDAITGTCTPNVMRDYVLRLNFALEKIVLENIKFLERYLPMHLGIKVEEFDYEEQSMPLSNNSMHFFIESDYAANDEFLIIV